MLRWVCCALALSLVACTQNTQAKDEKAKAKEPAGKVKLTPQAAEKALMHQRLLGCLGGQLDLSSRLFRLRLLIFGLSVLSTGNKAQSERTTNPSQHGRLLMTPLPAKIVSVGKALTRLRLRHHRPDLKDSRDHRAAPV